MSSLVQKEKKISQNKGTITKSIRFAPEDSELLKRISKAQHLSEAALMKKFVLEGIARYRLEEAIRAYSQGEVDLSAAAYHAGISVYRMLNELQRRGITPSAATEKFLDGLETLAETFGGSEALFQTIAEMRKGRVEGRIKPDSR
jgi:predicted HTH domain antitoxin